jgi:hypothetical protein
MDSHPPSCFLRNAPPEPAGSKVPRDHVHDQAFAQATAGRSRKPARMRAVLGGVLVCALLGVGAGAEETAKAGTSGKD